MIAWIMEAIKGMNILSQNELFPQMYANNFVKHLGVVRQTSILRVSVGA